MRGYFFSRKAVREKALVLAPFLVVAAGCSRENNRQQAAEFLWQLAERSTCDDEQLQSPHLLELREQDLTRRVASVMVRRRAMLGLPRDATWEEIEDEAALRTTGWQLFQAAMPELGQLDTVLRSIASRAFDPGFKNSDYRRTKNEDVAALDALLLAFHERSHLIAGSEDDYAPANPHYDRFAQVVREAVVFLRPFCDGGPPDVLGTRWAMRWLHRRNASPLEADDTPVRRLAQLRKTEPRRQDELRSTAYELHDLHRQLGDVSGSLITAKWAWAWALHRTDLDPAETERRNTAIVQLSSLYNDHWQTAKAVSTELSPAPRMNLADLHRD